MPAPAWGPRAEAAYWSPSPVHGYRVWRVQSRALTGARRPWRAPAMTAVCLRTGATAGVPHWNGECGAPGCGIYARRELRGIRGLRARASVPGTVAGLVSLSGTVVEHEHGYRAERSAVLAAGSLWGDRLVVGWSDAWLAALFADPVATLSGRGPMAQIEAPVTAGGRGVSMAILADRLEEIGADPSALGREG